MEDPKKHSLVRTGRPMRDASEYRCRACGHRGIALWRVRKSAEEQLIERGMPKECPGPEEAS
jgi:hypothetical protein